MSNTTATVPRPPAHTVAARQRAQLLVVDDDSAMCDLLRDELEDEGFTVDVASGGRAALLRLARGDIDVVVCRELTKMYEEVISTV